MLNPQSPFHRRLGRFLFWLPNYQKRWQSYMGRFMPILEPAFQHNEAARLLVMKALRQIKNGNLRQAEKTLLALKPCMREAEPADKALFSFLYGFAYAQAGDHAGAARYYRWANKFDHRYFLPYMLAADDDVNLRAHASRAAANYQTAIDCIYEYPPLNEFTRHALCMAYAGLCLCHVMMHDYDIAKADLLHAEQMESENRFILQAKAYLHAALRQTQEARSCVEKFSEYGKEDHALLQERIERILADQDPHFTQLPIGSPEGIAAFWQNFLDQQYEIMQLIRSNRGHDACEHVLGPLREMECYKNVYYGFDVTLCDGMFTLYFRSNFSRTYTPWIDAILAVCPAKVRAHWNIIRDP